jgi:hypothetical protein
VNRASWWEPECTVSGGIRVPIKYILY